MVTSDLHGQMTMIITKSEVLVRRCPLVQTIEDNVNKGTREDVAVW